MTFGGIERDEPLKNCRFSLGLFGLGKLMIPVLAKLRWDSVVGADAYVVVRDSKEITGPIRIEGANKEWTDKKN